MAARRSAWSRAKTQMAPSKVLTRFFTGGQDNSPKAVRKAVLRAAVRKLATREVSRQTPEAYAKRTGQTPRSAKQAPTAKKPAAKGNGKRPAAYERALLIPEQNRRAAPPAAKNPPGRPGKSEPIRGDGGKFNGRTPGTPPSMVYQPQLGQAPPPDLRPRRLFGVRDAVRRPPGP